MNQNPQTTQIPDELMDKIQHGECVLFLGSGMSIEAGMPSSSHLVATLKGQPSEPLQFVAERFESKYGRVKLCEELQNVFKETATYKKPGSFPFVVNIPFLNRLVLTTNWDNMLELAFEEEKKRYLVIKREEELTLLPTSPHTIIKLHGNLDDPDTLIITRSDYARIMSRFRYPGGFIGLIASLLTTRTLIFVGYSMKDEDFNLILSFIKTRAVDLMGRPMLMPHYAIMPASDEVVELLRYHYNIQVIQLEAREFLAAVFRKTTEFINRDTELRQICELISKPYVEFYGNAGCGKTKLLRGIESYYRLVKGWRHIISVDLREQAFSPASLLRRMAAQIHSRAATVGDLIGDLTPPLALFTFDSTEKADEETMRWLETELMLPLSERQDRREGEYRFIFAGRYSRIWSYPTRRRLESFPLSPFDPPSVEEMVRKYTFAIKGELWTKVDCAGIAREILAVAGTGHPKLIKTVLDEILQRDDLPTPLEKKNYIRDNQRELIPKLVEIVRNEIMVGCDKDIVALLENALCVFRRFNANTLEFLAKNAGALGITDVTVFQSPFDLLTGRLTGTYLVALPTREDPMYVLDSVVRRALTLHLQLAQEELYIRLNRLAVQMYTAWGRDSADHFQLAFIVEGLYHQLRFLEAQKKERPEAQAEIEKMLSDYRGVLSSSLGPQGVATLVLQLKSIIEKDQELTDSLFALLGSQGYERLIQLVETL